MWWPYWENLKFCHIRRSGVDVLLSRLLHYAHAHTSTSSTYSFQDHAAYTILTRYRSEDKLTRMRSSPIRTFSPSDLCLEAGWIVHQQASPTMLHTYTCLHILILTNWHSKQFESSTLPLPRNENLDTCGCTKSYWGDCSSAARCEMNNNADKKWVQVLGCHNKTIRWAAEM